MRYLTLTVLLFINLPAITQSAQDTIIIYFNKDWNKTTMDNAAYMAKAWQVRGKWHRQDFFYPERVLQMDGWYAANDFKVMDGPFYYYNKDGTSSNNYFYVKGSIHSSGYFTTEKHAVMDKIEYISYWWRSDSTLDYKSIADSAGDGVDQYYQPDGKTIAAEGGMKAGKRTGKWYFKDKNNVTGVKAVFEADSVISITCFNERGEPESNKQECIIEKAPELKGGVERWRRFLERNLEYPLYAMRKKITGVVSIQFFVEADGSVSELKVLKSPHSSLSNEAIRIMRLSPAWEPAIQYNRKVRFRHVQNITFVLQ